MNNQEIKRLDEISCCLHNLLNGQNPEMIDLDDQPMDEISQVSEFVNRLISEQIELTLAIETLSRGDLDFCIKSKCQQAQRLKAFQATLKHMVWQTGQVAKGDYEQRVDFLGDFSRSFNSMVEQLASSRDELAHQLAKLEILATTDPLTGLCNRRNFLKKAAMEFDSLQRYHHPLAVLMFDLDHFKKINDRYGHAAGDETLKAVANICRKMLRSTDMVARIGGEEFVVMFREAERKSALKASNRLCDEMATTPVLWEGMTIQFSMSGGLAQASLEDQNIEQTMKRADEALYNAKNGGRNRIVSIPA